MDDFKHGIAPGIDAPTSDYGLTATNSQPAKNLTNEATEIIAFSARIKAVILRFGTWMAVAVRGLS